MKSLNLENWCNGTFNVNFLHQKSSKSFWILFSLKNTNVGANFSVIGIFWFSPNFKSLYFLKWCLIFDSLPLLKFSQVNNLIWIQSFFSQDLSNFISLPWKLHNRYCHSIKLSSSFLVFWLDCFLSYSINWWHLTRTI